MRANTKGSGAAALRAVVVLLAALAAGAGAARPLALEAKPALVPVGVYVESLCPGCRNFISTMLRPAVAKGLGAIMDLTIVPYGNAKASSGGVSCQHGPEECFLNKIEQCVLHHYPAKALEFIFCLEDEKSPVGTALAIECALAGGIHWTAMSTCAKGEEGEKYQVEAAAATPKDHKWVPW